ncbi:glycosyltransferase family 4 protein [Helicobacter sp. MIT 14-3879]|uniref:glycosyltransferase family 4 protein n=1 Tax=Helicobacter sp. MIT 14-3879 TaxID=2040649 RepID=UPI000E1EE7B2|nr:glycosyltransferase family 4 protein [Helicobacter sp. MIT 14-3879]RDU63995.1 glycosyl transferase family 1 [Helicobacter sp. MIT 14-3879]
MRVVHITTSDSGGAGRACVRLHKALLQFGIDSIILTNNKTIDIPSIIRVAKTKPQKLLEKLRPALSQLPLIIYKRKHKEIFSPNIAIFNPKNKALLKMLDELKPDIIHLHWIESGFLNIKDLLYFNAPIIWSMHDSNPYTGGCHYVAPSCTKANIECKKCPLLNSNYNYDLSYLTFKRKQKTYTKLKNLTIIGLSSWITDCAKKSALLKDKQIINLPNPIDTEVYKPISKETAKDLLGINKDTKIIAFGAISATSIKRKGYRELREALSLLKNKSNIKLVVFGSSNKEDIERIKTIYMGHLYDDISLRIIYSLSDVFVAPSLAENLSNAIMESLACGTPVIAFDIGGNKDMIKHLYNGYLAKPYDINDLARGIEWILESNNYKNISNNAIKSVKEKFDSKLITNKYIEVYNTLLNRGGVESNLIITFYFNKNSFTQNSYYKNIFNKTLNKPKFLRQVA